MNGEFVLVRCPACGVKNRVAQHEPNLRPKCGRCGTPLLVADGTVVTVTDSNFSQKVLSANLPVLLDCWAPWCGPCRMIGPIVEEIASEYAGRAIVAKLNVDENPVIAQQFGIQSIPTLLIFKDGEVVDRMVGALPKNEIVTRLDRVLG